MTMVLLHVVQCAAAHRVTVMLSRCVLWCGPACHVVVAWSCTDATVRCSPTCCHLAVAPGCAAPRRVTVVLWCAASRHVAVVLSRRGALLPVMSPLHRSVQLPIVLPLRRCAGVCSAPC